MAKYLEQIANADTIDALNAIVEAAAFDDDLTGKEYCAIYDAALRKAQAWQGATA